MDMDGTLFRNDKTIGEETKKALLKASEKGIILTIASGREKRSVEGVIKELHMEEGNHYMAGMNGQIIYSFLKNEVSVDRLFEGNDAQRVIQLAKKMNFEAIIGCGYDYYDYIRPVLKCKKKIRSLLFGKPMDYGLAHTERTFTQIDETKEFTQDVTKIILIQTPRYFKKNLAKIREALPDMDVLAVGEAWIEINPKGVHKGRAVLKIAKENGILPEEIMAFGDAENDKEMLECVGYGIAMGNAMPQVKKVAFDVTDTNMNDGIAKAIYKYIDLS